MHIPSPDFESGQNPLLVLGGNKQLGLWVPVTVLAMADSEEKVVAVIMVGGPTKGTGVTISCYSDSFDFYAKKNKELSGRY